MKYQTTKSEKDIPIGSVLKGAEFTTVDNSLKALTLDFGDGKMVKCSMESYSFIVAVPAKPKMIDAWSVSARIGGETILKIFQGSYEAENFRDKIESAADQDSLLMTATQVPEDYDFGG